MDRIRLIVIVAGMAAGIWGAVGSLRTPTPAPAPVVNPSSILEGVGSSDAALLKEFYAAMADIVVRDGKAQAPLCKTVFDLRGRHKQALQMAFVATAIVNKYEGLGERLDSYLLKAVGETDLPLTPELRQSAAKAFLSIK
jgi:hypothetical protein